MTTGAVRFARERGGAHVLFTAASAVVVVAGLKAASSLLVPMLLALLMSFVSLPVFGLLVRARIPRGVAVFLTIVFDLAVLLAAVVLVGAALRDATELMPVYQERLAQADVDLDEWLHGYGFPPVDLVGDPNLGVGAMGEVVQKLLRGVVSVGSQALLVMLTVAFVLLEAAGFPSKLAAAFRDGDAKLAHFAHARLQVQRYLAVKSVASATTGVLLGLWVAWCGLDAPVLWGLLAFILNFVPTIGSILAAIPAILAALVQGDAPLAIAVAIGYVLVNLAIGNIIEPMVMGRRLGLSTLVVFLSLLFWGWVLGPVGAILAVPLTTVLKILLENTKDLNWIGIMLSARPPRRTDP